MDSLEILYGQTQDIPELEYDENLEREADSIQRYASYALIYTIGTEEFEETYKTLINNLKNQDMSKLRDAVIKMFDKIYDVYDYELPGDLNLNDQEEIYKFFDFVSFIEFDNVGFLSIIWSKLINDMSELKNLDIEGFCNEKREFIYDLIENSLKVYTYNEIITTFLRTYSKLVNWFVSQSRKNRFSIIFENLTKTEE